MEICKATTLQLKALKDLGRERFKRLLRMVVHWKDVGEIIFFMGQNYYSYDFEVLDHKGFLSIVYYVVFVFCNVFISLRLYLQIWR